MTTEGTTLNLQYNSIITIPNSKGNEHWWGKAGLPRLPENLQRQAKPRDPL